MFHVTDSSGHIKSSQLASLPADWEGTTNITILGTIATGVWNATAIAWDKVDKTGAVPGDVGAEAALGNPATNNFCLISQTDGTRSWAGREPSLGNPASNDYFLSSQTDGTRSWVAAPSPPVTDDTSTNATMYPVWVDASTGSPDLKVSSTQLTWNPSLPLLTISGGGVGDALKVVLNISSPGAGPGIEFTTGSYVGAKIYGKFPGSSRAELIFYTGAIDSAAEAVRIGSEQNIKVRSTDPNAVRYHTVFLDKHIASEAYDPQIAFAMSDTVHWAMGIIDASSDVFVIGRDPGSPNRVSQATAVLTLTKSSGTELAGTLKIGSLGAFAAGDKYLIVDASGNVHVSALGPAS